MGLFSSEMVFVLSGCCFSMVFSRLVLFDLFVLRMVMNLFGVMLRLRLFYSMCLLRVSLVLWRESRVLVIFLFF